MVQNNSQNKFHKKTYDHKPDHKLGHNNHNSFIPCVTNPIFKKRGECYICGKPGHHAPQCRHRKNNDNPSKGNLAEEEDITVVLLLKQIL